MRVKLNRESYFFKKNRKKYEIETKEDDSNRIQIPCIKLFTKNI